jgi:Amt family ammonium transporter
VLAFSALWLLIVYAPVAHWVWGGGWLMARGVVDFAGGLVVHATAGVSALAFVIMLGARRAFPGDLSPPHSPGMTLIGAAMLWVGWFGFNAGSAVAANGTAAMAMTVTHVSAATAALAWMSIEWIKYGKPSLIGLVTGMVAGLATITPAAGSVGPAGALVIGAVSGVVCYFAVQAVKHRFKIDDSLDVFAVHGVGGVLGTLSIPFLAAFGPGAPGLNPGMTFASQLGMQALGVAAVVAWSAIGSFAILFVLKQAMDLRVEPEVETEGLDIPTHGERGYSL